MSELPKQAFYYRPEDSGGPPLRCTIAAHNTDGSVDLADLATGALIVRACPVSASGAPGTALLLAIDPDQR